MKLRPNRQVAPFGAHKKDEKLGDDKVAPKAQPDDGAGRSKGDVQAAAADEAAPPGLRRRSIDSQVELGANRNRDGWVQPAETPETEPLASPGRCQRLPPIATH